MKRPIHNRLPGEPPAYTTVKRSQSRCIVIGCDRYAGHPWRGTEALLAKGNGHGSMPLLCRLGFHRWRWFRYCQRCGKRKPK